MAVGRDAEAFWHPGGCARWPMLFRDKAASLKLRCIAEAAALDPLTTGRDFLHCSMAGDHHPE